MRGVRDSLQHWSGPEAQAAASWLVVFGHNKSGGLFAYWRYRNQPVDEAPIVLLDSEGVAFSAVLANSLSDFLKLLAAGDEELFSLPDEEDEYLPVLEDLKRGSGRSVVLRRWEARTT